MVGEQPGDAEDLAGHPFVGPAGTLLDRALAGSGHRSPRRVYVTNVVKHFKWEPRGKRRIHAKPNSAEIARLPSVARDGDRARQAARLVCLGATAAQALLGRAFKVSQQRGTFVAVAAGAARDRDRPSSSILRAPDDESRRAEMKRFVADLKRVARELARKET